MYIRDLRPKDAVEFSLREFAKRARTGVVFDLEHGDRFVYDPYTTPVTHLLLVLPNKESDEDILVVFFREKDTRVVVDDTITIHNLHEMIVILNTFRGQYVTLVSERGFLRTYLDAGELGDIIEEFFLP